MSFTTKDIWVYRYKNAYCAERHGDPLFVGMTREPVWKKRLNRKNVCRINQYMNDVKCLRKYIDVSAIEYISAIVRNDTLINYEGQYCFGFALEDYLFENEYEQLKTKQRLRLDSLSHFFQGIYYPGVVARDSAGQYLFLTRQYQPEASYSPDCTWEFLPSGRVKNSCQSFNLKFSNDTFSIYSGGFSLQMGFAGYEVLEMNPEGILLKNTYSDQKTPPRH